MIHYNIKTLRREDFVFVESFEPRIAVAGRFIAVSTSPNLLHAYKLQFDQFLFPELEEGIGHSFIHPLASKIEVGLVRYLC